MSLVGAAAIVGSAVAQNEIVVWAVADMDLGLVELERRPIFPVVVDGNQHDHLVSPFLRKALASGRRAVRSFPRGTALVYT